LCLGNRKVLLDKNDAGPGMAGFAVVQEREDLLPEGGFLSRLKCLRRQRLLSFREGNDLAVRGRCMEGTSHKTS
jgi:hypothetical protein